MTLAAGPGANTGLRIRTDACWARVGGTADYPVVCNEPEVPGSIGLCALHLALYRKEP